MDKLRQIKMTKRLHAYVQVCGTIGEDSPVSQLGRIQAGVMYGFLANVDVGEMTYVGREVYDVLKKRNLIDEGDKK